MFTVGKLGKCSIVLEDVLADFPLRRRHGGKINPTSNYAGI